LERLENENREANTSLFGNRNREESKNEDEEFADKFAQTFYKYMQNLSNRKFIDIINTPVDHEDRALIFYQ